MIAYPQLPKRDLLQWLVSNKDTVIAQKKATVKLADAISSPISFFAHEKDAETTKSEPISETATIIKVRSIVNTTKLFDSHQDVHMDQLWNKSIKETKQNYLVKEHKFSFDGIISDNVKVFAKQMTWAELGFDYDGSTQALIYDSVISKAESPDMFARYAAGKVNQHSVGMRYVKIELAVNDDRHEKEYSAWQKYFDVIANKEDVMDAGFFYAVTEAKNIEGSAVVRGSNFATPTYSVAQIKNFTEVKNEEDVENLTKVHIFDPSIEPPSGTQKEPLLSSTRAIELLKNHYQPLKHI